MGLYILIKQAKMEYVSKLDKDLLQDLQRDLDLYKNWLEQSKNEDDKSIFKNIKNIIKSKEDLKKRILLMNGIENINKSNIIPQN
tara:strand:+ start:99 stop:353 length:255 start_codon:yes stop_codon:yes gene_type:complete